ncbi:MAG TPA: hypothetical protein VGD81_06245 [Opitutaceae bacterium]
MRPQHPLVLVTLAVLFAAPAMRADDPSRVDAAKRSESFAPPATTVAPGKRELPKAEAVQERRAAAPEKVEKKSAPAAGRRAAVDLEESREKTIIDKQTRPRPEAPPRELNAWNKEPARIQPGATAKPPEFVERYQSRMKDAAAAASQSKPELEKRTTFSSLNRFVFRKNQPEGDTITPAGGGAGSRAPRP